MKRFKSKNVKSHAFGDVHDIVLSMIDHSKKHKILDAATGNGCLAYNLKKLGHKVTASDIKPKDLKEQNVEIHIADLNEELLYQSNTFDYVTHIETFEHLRNPGLCLSEFNRVLKPNGILILTAPNIVNIQSKLLFILFGQYHNFYNFKSSYRYNDGSDRHILPLPPWLIKVFLENSNFEVISVSYSVGGIEIPTKKKPWLKLVFLPRFKCFGNSVIIKAKAKKKSSNRNFTS